MVNISYRINFLTGVKLEPCHNYISNGKDVSLEFLEERGLIALQGPESAKVLQHLTSVELSTMAFMTGATGSIAGVDDCRITRCG